MKPEDILAAMAVCDLVNLRRIADVYDIPADDLLMIYIKTLKRLKKADILDAIDASWLHD